MRSALIPLGALFVIGIACLFSMDGVVEHGKQVYAEQKCSICHSIGGSGAGKAALDGVGSKLKPADIKKWSKTPKEMKASVVMKSYPNLPDTDLDDLIAYLRTLK